MTTDRRNENTTTRLLQRARADAISVLDGNARRLSRMVGLLFLAPGLFAGEAAAYIGATLAVVAAFFFSYRAVKNAPTLKQTALRLEKRYAQGLGSWLAAYDLERSTRVNGSARLTRRAIELAVDELSALDSRPRRERGLAALGVSDDRRLERLALVLDVLVSASLLLSCVLVVAPSTRHALEEPKNDVTARETPTQSELERDAATTFEGSPTSQDVSEPPSNADLAAELAALRDVLARLVNLYDALQAEPVDEDIYCADKLVKEIWRYVNAPHEGAIASTARTLACAKLTYPSVLATSASGREIAAAFLSRNLEQFSALWQDSKTSERRVVDALGTLGRSNDSQERRDALEAFQRECAAQQAALREESQALALFARSWTFGAKLDELETRRIKAYGSVVDLLSARAGRFPWDDASPDAQVDAFLSQLEVLSNIINKLEIDANELREDLKRPENTSFIASIEEIARATETYDALFTSNNYDRAQRTLAGYRALCAGSAEDARNERWGLATNALSKRFDALAVDAETNATESDAYAELAAALTWGTVFDARETRTVNEPERVKKSSDGDTPIAAEEQSRADNELANTDVELPSKVGSTGTTDQAATRDDALSVKRASSSGTLFDAGASPDASFAGGGAGMPAEAATEPASTAFILRDDKKTHERFELSESWAPGAAEEAKTKRFQERLQELLQRRDAKK